MSSRGFSGWRARRSCAVIAPPRLGRSFRFLLAAAIVNNAGDGVVIAAGPLLVASQTHDPFLVSLALLSEYLPIFVFGLVGGVIADRVNRRQMVVVANVSRALPLAVLVATILTGTVSIAVVLLALFALGTAEVFADKGDRRRLRNPSTAWRWQRIADTGLGDVSASRLRGCTLSCDLRP